MTDDPAMTLADGLYERLLTARLRRAVDAVIAQGGTAEVSSVDSAELAQTVAVHLAPLIVRALDGVAEKDRAAVASALVGEIATRLAAHAPRAVDAEDESIDVPTLLTSVAHEVGLGPRPLVRPTTPLAASDLLTNARGEPTIGSELLLELASADGVDLICAFIRWSGIRRMRDGIRALTEVGRPVRIITTTYLGSTERKALDELVRLGADVRVSYETDRTRLHAKAWLFKRRTGFSTAYVGSSNLSTTALHEGLEWNVRLSQATQPDLIAKFEATFDSYWNNPQFEPYEPERDGERFDQAIGRARVGEELPLDIAFLDLEPKPFQARILDQLEVERRVHGRWRNLVVAATGTGKTVIAALDYRRLRETLPRANLLFVAHRREILQQSRSVFRHALRDGAFGELYVDGHRPEEWREVFASVQSLTSLGATTIDPRHFDVLIVDEFHHAAAGTYRDLLDHLEPTVLLGLTATPERADGQSVTEWFGDRFAAELRLWDAIDEGLLVPFQYFGLHDDVDLSHLRWQRGGYLISELENLYTGNDLRVAKVLESLRDKVLDLAAMRALGFCVSVEHARYMARRFNQAGIPAEAVSADTPGAERENALRKLRLRELNAVFAVDLFNEGVDVPEVDTVLMLRPTESATVFLQQLGRGLRHARDKACLTVFDFVGQQHRQFRFDLRYRALAPGSRRDLEHQIDNAFPFLPAGCSIDLDRDVKKLVLRNLKEAVPTTWPRRVAELRALGEVDLATYLHETGLELDDVSRGRRSWARLREAAGLGPPVEGPDSDRLVAAVARLVHVDDQERLDTWTAFLTQDVPPPVPDDPRQRRLLTMLHFQLWGVSASVGSLADGFDRLWAVEPIRLELVETFALLGERISHVGAPLGLPLPVPITLHARYSRDEILAAFGIGSAEQPPSVREGVKYDDASNTDLFFVTLNKSERDYSPSTLYRDYAISPTEFHWESQSTTSVDSRPGRRYLNGESNVVLFAREQKVGPTGAAAPYMALGPCRYVSHEGDRPISITWRLATPMPADLFQEARVAAG